MPDVNLACASGVPFLESFGFLHPAQQAQVGGEIGGGDKGVVVGVADHPPPAV